MLPVAFGRELPVVAVPSSPSKRFDDVALIRFSNTDLTIAGNDVLMVSILRLRQRRFERQGRWRIDFSIRLMKIARDTFA